MVWAATLASADPGPTLTAAVVDPAVPKTCKKGTVLATFGESGNKCVKAGDACNRKRNAAYTRVELRCVRRTIRKGRKRVKAYRLRKLTGPERRFGAPARAASNGRISRDVALAAFEKAFRADIPGFKAPKGLVGSFEDGTAPLAWVNTHRKRLTRAQRKAIDRALRPTRAALRKTQAAPVFTMEEMQAALDTAASWVSSYLGVQLAFKPTLEAVGDDPDEAAALALPKFDSSGALNFCAVQVTPKGFRYKKYPVRNIHALLAHELVHCLQGQAMGSAYDTRAWGTSWVIEGFARFAAVEMAAINDPGETREKLNAVLDNSKTFLEHPEVPVLQRTYDANNFWQMLADAGIPPIEAYNRALAALKGGASTEQVFETVIATAGEVPTERLLFEAGPGLLRRTDWGPVWDIRGESVHPTATPLSSEQVEIANDSGAVTVAAIPYTFAAKNLSLTADFISVQSLPGTRGRLHVRDGSPDGLAIDDALYTTLDDPKCPNGSPVPGIAGHFNVGEAGVGISGGSQSATVAIKGQSLASVCGTGEPPCTLLCDKPRSKGGSNGDPHLTSLDGLHYDFQAAGEFVLVKSGSDLEIQARQQLAPNTKDATMNTQLGIRAGGQRLTVSPGEQPRVRIGGNTEDLPADQPRELAGGASVVRSQEGDVRVMWADGSAVDIRSVGGFGLSIDMELAFARSGKTAGLLGNFDGDLRDDLIDRSGKKVPYTLRPDKGWSMRRGQIKEEYSRTFSDRLYKTYGESWRVSQSRSLLHYASGQSTATFTNRSIPKNILDPQDLEGRAEAERICREKGVTDSGPLEDCILDVHLTGDAAFADDALIAQQAGRVTWTAVEGADGVGDAVSLTIAGDGLLHAAYARDPGDGGEVPTSVPISAAGVAGQRETIAAGPGRPTLFTGNDGAVRAVTGETSKGIYQYGRGGDGTWTARGLVTDAANSFYGYPSAVEAPGGALVTAAPGLTNAQLFVGSGPGNAGVPLATSGNCDATSPALAVESGTGQVWVAWVQSRSGCELPGVLVRQFDPASRSFVGAPQVAPGSSAGVRVDERVAFTSRPGQAGLFVAFGADAGDNARVWQVGSPTSTAVAKRDASVRNVRLAAAPQGGALWLAWHESDSTRRVWVQRIAAGGAADGAPRAAAPPPGTSIGLDHFQISSRAGSVEIVGGALGRLWYTRISG